MIAVGLGANANELARDWPLGQYRGGHPDWVAVGQAVRAVDYNRSARYTGVIGKGDRAWMFDRNVVLYRPAPNAFVNTIGAGLGATTSTMRSPVGIGASFIVMGAVLGGVAYLLLKQG